jgi:hypothetical protein
VFLQPDQYAYLSRGGTLWSWPGQNPFRWADPSGRIGSDGASTDRAIGSPQDWGDPSFQEGMQKGGAVGAAAIAATLAGGIEAGVGALLLRALASANAWIRGGGAVALASAGAVKQCANDGVSTRTTPLLNTARGNLLQGAQNARLRNLIEQMYRRTATVGSGSTADAVRHELRTGELLSRSGHSIKGQEMIRALERTVAEEPLDAGDLQIARHLRDDLQRALSGN